MTSFAPIASVAISEKLEYYGLYGNYHLLIASEVLKRGQAWSDLFSNIAAKRKVMTILDNGVVETGQALSVRDLLVAAYLVRADFVVLPDVIGVAPSTIVQSLDAMTEFLRIGPSLVSFMAVVQGSSFDEAVTCAQEFARHPEITALAIPRHFQRCLGTRVDLVREVFQETGLSMHLLGFSDNIEDDLTAARQVGVMGIDSAVPIWWGLRGNLMDRPVNKMDQRPPGFWEQKDLTLPMIANIVHIREELRRGE